MALWVILGVLAAIILWLLWGKKRYALYKASKHPKVEGTPVGPSGELKGVTDSVSHGQGQFFSRATGAFSAAIG